MEFSLLMKVLEFSRAEQEGMWKNGLCSKSAFVCCKRILEAVRRGDATVVWLRAKFSCWHSSVAYVKWTQQGLQRFAALDGSLPITEMRIVCCGLTQTFYNGPKEDGKLKMDEFEKLCVVQETMLLHQKKVSKLDFWVFHPMMYDRLEKSIVSLGGFESLTTLIFGRPHDDAQAARFFRIVGTLQFLKKLCYTGRVTAECAGAPLVTILDRLPEGLEVLKVQYHFVAECDRRIHNTAFADAFFAREQAGGFKHLEKICFDRFSGSQIMKSVQFGRVLNSVALLPTLKMVGINTMYPATWSEEKKLDRQRAWLRTVCPTVQVWFR